MAMLMDEVQGKAALDPPSGDAGAGPGRGAAATASEGGAGGPPGPAAMPTPRFSEFERRIEVAAAEPPRRPSPDRVPAPAAQLAAAGSGPVMVWKARRAGTTGDRPEGLDLRLGGEHGWDGRARGGGGLGLVELGGVLELGRVLELGGGRGRGVLVQRGGGGRRRGRGGGGRPGRVPAPTR